MPDDLRWSWCNNSRNIVHNKCNALELFWNRPLIPKSVEKLSSTKPVTGAKKVGDCCSKCVLVTQSCLTLCNPMNYSPLGSSVHGILQARILGWVAIPFSRGSSQPRDWLKKESSPAPQLDIINSLVLILLYGSNLTSIYDYWKSHKFDYMHIWQQGNFSAF